VAGGQRPGDDALIAQQVAAQCGAAGVQVQGAWVKGVGVEPAEPAVEQMCGEGEVLCVERARGPIEVVAPRLVVIYPRCRVVSLAGAARRGTDHLKPQAGSGVASLQGGVEYRLHVRPRCDADAVLLPFGDRSHSDTEVRGENTDAHAHGAAQRSGV
jgi:hypothetical protein